MFKCVRLKSFHFCCSLTTIVGMNVREAVVKRCRRPFILKGKNTFDFSTFFHMLSLNPLSTPLTHITTFFLQQEEHIYCNHSKIEQWSLGA
jgi:hypothetical protein